MADLTLRLEKGSELTFREIDDNFLNLDSDTQQLRREVDSNLQVYFGERDSDFLAILQQRDSDAAVIILTELGTINNNIDSLNDRVDSEHAWNVSEHDSLHGYVGVVKNELQTNIDSVNTSLQQNVTSINNEITNINNDLGNVQLAHSFNVQGVSFDGSLDRSVNFVSGTSIFIDGYTINNTAPDQIVTLTGAGATTVTGTYPNFTITSTDTDNDTQYTAGTGLSLVGTQFTNTAPDQTVTLTGSGATTVSGSYPNFTVSSTDTNTDTQYTAGTGLTLVGSEFRNTAPDQTVSLTGSGATTVTGTYPNFTVSSTDNNTTYTAGNGLSLIGTELKMSGSYTGTFTATGDVVAYSDVALKSEVNAIDQALDKLMAITGYTYKKEGSDRRYSGVMAQDVEKVLPEVVHTSEDGVKGVAYGNMMGLVIEAIRELKTQVEELKNK